MDFSVVFMVAPLIAAIIAFSILFYRFRLKRRQNSEESEGMTNLHQGQFAE